MSNTIKILFTEYYCCSEPEAELYTVKMFAPLPEEPEEGDSVEYEYDDECELIEKTPVVYSDDQKKTIELYKILNDIIERDSSFSIEYIKDVIVSYELVSYELVKANEDRDVRRRECDFNFTYTVC